MFDGGDENMINLEPYEILITNQWNSHNYNYVVEEDMAEELKAKKNNTIQLEDMDNQQLSELLQTNLGSKDEFIN